MITVCSGLAPIKSKKFRESSHLLGIANTFSGGVFLAIAFVHIIPETSNNYYMTILERNEVLSQVNRPQQSYQVIDGVATKVQMEYTQNQINQEVKELLDASFPLPFVLVLLGYSFILLIDKVLIDSHDAPSEVAIEPPKAKENNDYLERIKMI